MGNSVTDSVSIVIPSTRIASSLPFLLRQIRDQGFHGRILIVTDVDAAASGHLTGPCHGFGIELVGCALPHATARRNVGIKNVTTDWVLFLDDDVVLANDYLQILAHMLSEHDVQIIQGNPCGCANRDRMLARWEEVVYKQVFQRYVAGTTVASCDPRNLCVRTAVARSFCFNETLRHAGEGHELADRLGRAGIQIRYAPNLQVYHLNRAKCLPLIRQKFSHGLGRAQVLHLRHSTAPSMLRQLAKDAFRHTIYPLSCFASGNYRPWHVMYFFATHFCFWCGITFGVLKNGTIYKQKD